MKRRFLIVVCGFLFFCSSCTNIKNKKVTDENKDKILGEISTSKGLTDDERQLLAGYIMRQNLSSVFQGGKPSIPTGKTIGEMIEDQRKWLKEDAEKERVQKEKEQQLATEISAKEAALRELVTVTLYDLKESDAGFMRGFNATIAFKAGNKDIRAFEGNLALSDVLGNSLGDIPVKVLRPLKANESGTTNYSNAYMAFPELAGKHLEDVKTNWKPTKLILTDPTELTVPEMRD
jgi:hypothetical protein